MMHPSKSSLLAVVLLLGMAAPAFAVSNVGKAERIDKDPGGTQFYGLHIYQVTRTPKGGFGVAWNEDDKSVNGDTGVIDRIGFRIYDKTFKPVAKQAFADVKQRTGPGIVELLPLGTSGMLLVFAGKAPPKHIDDPGDREILAHVIALSNGKAGARKRLDDTASGDETVARATALAGGRALVGWYQLDNDEDVVGRFVSAAGTPGPTNLQFSCCDGSDLLWLGPLDNGFLALIRHASLFDTDDESYGQIYKSNGATDGPRKDLDEKLGIAPLVRTLDDGRIVVMKYLEAGDHTKLTAQLYDSDWKKVGKPKTLIPDITDVKFIEFAPTPDGGLLFGQLVLKDAKYTRLVRKLDASLKPTGTSYSLKSDFNDFFQLAALSPTRAVMVFRKIVNSRSQLFFQILDY